MQVKGACSRLAKFVYNFFLPKNFYISNMKPPSNGTNITKLTVHGTELRVEFEERENKPKNDQFLLKIESYLSFDTKMHYALFINIKGS